MVIQRTFLSSSLVFLGMITVFFPQTSVAIFHRRRPINGGQIATMAQCCSHTDYPILCNFMLKPLRSGTCEQATMAAIRATILQVNQAKAFVARQKAKVSQKKQELDVCLEVYDSAIYDLKTSLTNLMSRPELLLSSLSAAMGDISTCDDALNESGVVSPVSRINELLTMFISNLLALATELKH